MASRNIFDACHAKDRELVASLLADDPSLKDSVDDNGLTPLAIVASDPSGSDEGYEIAVELIRSGATHENLSTADFESGYTPLHRALYFRNLRIAVLLMKAGATLDCVNTEEFETLRASVSCKKQVGRRHIPNIDNDGHSPLDLLSTSLQSNLALAAQEKSCSAVFAFGKADFQLGMDLPNLKTHVSRAKNVDTLNLKGVTSVAAARWHSVAVTRKGEVYSWGHAKHGRLGQGDDSIRPYPCLIKSLCGVVVTYVSVAENHCLALSDCGDLYAWGSSKYGQLGVGVGAEKETSRSSPILIKALKKHRILGCAAGEKHSVAFNDQGDLWVWGSNERGQLGHKGGSGTGLVYSPKQMWVGQNKQASTKILQVCASVYSTLLLRESREEGFSSRHPPYSNGSLNRQRSEVFQWGHGNHVPMRVTFSAGRAHTTSPLLSDEHSTPSSIRACTTRQAINIVQMSAGLYHNVALSSAKHVYTWGSGSDVLGQGSGGESGAIGSTVASRERESACGHLVEALLLENGGGRINYVVASVNRTCAVSEAGDLYTWGATEPSQQGVLGHGRGSSYQPLPKRVLGIKRAVSVAVGDDHTLVLTAASLPPLPLSDIVVVGSGAAAAAKRNSRSGSFSVCGEGMGESDDKGRRSRSGSKFDLIADDDEDEDADEREGGLTGRWLAGSEAEDDRRSRSDSLASIESGSLITSLLMEASSEENGAKEGTNRTESSLYFTHPPSLSSLCELAIAKMVDVQSAVSTLAFAEAAGTPLLHSFCSSFVERNLDAILVHTKQSVLDELLDGVTLCIEKKASSGSMGRREKRPSLAEGSFDNTETGVTVNPRDTKPVVDLTSLDSVNKRIRNLKKKIKFVEELEARSGCDKSEKENAPSPQKEKLTPEQREKMARKDVYASELKRLELVAFRLEGEQRVRVQAERSRQEAAAAAMNARKREKERAQIAAAARNPHRDVTFTQPGMTAGMAGKGKAKVGRGGGRLPQAVPPSFDEWNEMAEMSSSEKGPHTPPRVAAANPDAPSLSSFHLTTGRSVLSPKKEEESNVKTEVQECAAESATIARTSGSVTTGASASASASVPGLRAIARGDWVTASPSEHTSKIPPPRVPGPAIHSTPVPSSLSKAALRSPEVVTADGVNIGASLSSSLPPGFEVLLPARSKEAKEEQRKVQEVSLAAYMTPSKGKDSRPAALSPSPWKLLPSDDEGEPEVEGEASEHLSVSKEGSNLPVHPATSGSTGLLQRYSGGISGGSGNAAGGNLAPAASVSSATPAERKEKKRLSLAELQQEEERLRDEEILHNQMAAENRWQVGLVYARGVGSLDDSPSIANIAQEQEALRQLEKDAAREEARLAEERENIRLVAAFEKEKEKVKRKKKEGNKPSEGKGRTRKSKDVEKGAQDDGAKKELPSRDNTSKNRRGKPQERERGVEAGRTMAQKRGRHKPAEDNASSVTPGSGRKTKGSTYERAKNTAKNVDSSCAPVAALNVAAAVFVPASK